MINRDFSLIEPAASQSRYHGGALVSSRFNLDAVSQSEAAPRIARPIGLSRMEGVHG